MRFLSVHFLGILSLVMQTSAILTTSTCSATGEKITSAIGRITSPNYPLPYPGNSKCKWILNSANGLGIRLYVEYLDNQEVFQNGNKQCYDKLQITPGNTRDPIELCASDASELKKRTLDFQNKGSDSLVVEISFSSDYEDHKTGFSIYYESLCNSTETGEKGDIKSPIYLGKYQPNSNCFTTIKASVGNSIEIDFSTIRLEEQSFCSSDFISISDGYPGDDRGHKKIFCKLSELRGPLIFQSNIVTVQFVSDKTLSYSGFEATWRALVPTTTTESTMYTTTSTLLTTTEAMKNCSYTERGYTCQHWNVNTPHHVNHTPSDTNHNFCRIPDGDSRPWCYTTDPNRRYDYCDLENCVPMTTILPTREITTTVSTTESTTKSPKTLVAVFVSNETTAAKAENQVLDTPAWYFYLIIPVVLILILLLLVIFIRRRRRKGAARLQEPPDDTVQFNQMNFDDTRPRENTYVEIPCVLNTTRGNARNGQNGEGYSFKKGKEAFVSLERGVERNASTSSHDSVAIAKERARRDFEAGRPSTSSVGNYAAALDVACSSTACDTEKSPYQMAAEPEKFNTEENLYQTITMEGAQHSPICEVPPSPLPRVKSNSKMTKKDEKKKENKPKKSSKKFLLGKKKTSSGSLGFGNPSFQEKDKTQSGGISLDNPFDTDEEDAKTEPSEPRILLPSSSFSAEVSGNGDSPYMAPKLPRPNKEHMVTISPDIIDNKEVEKELNVVIEDSLYSTPNPTSPVFELETNFIYDLPKEPRPAAGSIDSSGSQGSDKGEGSSRSPNNASTKSRDSGNSSLHEMTLAEDDLNKTEYCTMNSVSRGSTTSSLGSLSFRKNKKSEETDDTSAENRLSRLYMSMQEGKTGEREDKPVDKKLYENLSSSQTTS